MTDLDKSGTDIFATEDPFSPAIPHGGWPRFQILSLDGGGLKGIFAAAILAAFEADLGIRIADRFDLIAGTSTGGLIALGLGAGLTPTELVDLYVDLGPRIFHDALSLKRLRQILRPKHDSSGLRSALDDVFGDRTLADSTKRLVIPSFNLGEDRVHIFKTPHHPRLTRDWRVSMVDVALATSAAPSFFAVHRLDHARLIDGGVWANNPAAVAVAEARSMLGVPLDAIRLFSLGATTDLRHRHGRLDRGGLIQWARAGTILDIVLGGQSSGTNDLVLHLVGRDRVLRLNPHVPPGLFSLDRADAQELIGKASTHSRTASPTFKHMFCGHTATEFIPFNQEREESADVGHA
jgi:predicted acylesterase/phospholipase RssA